jgi:prepilin-type N-terminal cleavage/methylation domain-containing protein
VGLKNGHSLPYKRTSRATHLCEKKSKNSGFSLIEIAIVVVVISLIIAAVAAYQTTITTSRSLKLISEVTSYKESVKLFEDRYRGKPGDITNPEDHFTAPEALVPGNGDGIIGSNGNPPENAVMFVQLGPKGGKFIPQDLNGQGDVIAMGQNRPISAVPSVGWTYNNEVNPLWPWAPNARIYDVWQALGGASLNEESVSVSIAKYIDDKIDDGIFNRGKVVGNLMGVGAVGAAWPVPSLVDTAWAADLPYVIDGDIIRYASGSTKVGVSFPNIVIGGELIPGSSSGSSGSSASSGSSSGVSSGLALV